jgi:hypothetical protein
MGPKGVPYTKTYWLTDWPSVVKQLPLQLQGVRQHEAILIQQLEIQQQQSEILKTTQDSEERNVTWLQLQFQLQLQNTDRSIGSIVTSRETQVNFITRLIKWYVNCYRELFLCGGCSIAYIHHPMTNPRNYLDNIHGLSFKYWKKKKSLTFKWIVLVKKLPNFCF